MKIKAIIFGATGMIGQGVLLECLADPRVESILVIGRKTCGKSHPKLKEILHDDFEDYHSIEYQLKGYNACFYCLGISSAGMSEENYHRITYTFSVKAAEVLSRLNPDMTFSFISGAGTDATEQGSTMWARVKGKAENAVQKFPFKATYMFRPAFIQPMKGVTSATRSYRIMYAIFKPLYPLLKGWPKYVSSSVKLGQAMINSADIGYEKTVLESIDINQLAEQKPQKTATHA